MANIRATERKHEEILRHILPLHALTGCDTVSSIYGVGKVKSVKALQTGHVPPPLGNGQIYIETIVSGATEFIAACYGSKCSGTLSQIRFKVWQSKTGRTKATSFKLPSRPPTSEAFGLHVRRAHHQPRLWRAAIHSDQPALTAAGYGWLADHATKTLLLIVLSPETMT